MNNENNELTVVKFGETCLKAIVFHAVLELPTRVLVIAFDHLWVLLAHHCKKSKIINYKINIRIGTPSDANYQYLLT